MLFPGLKAESDGHSSPFPETGLLSDPMDASRVRNPTAAGSSLRTTSDDAGLLVVFCARSCCRPSSRPDIAQPTCMLNFAAPREKP